MTAIGERFKDVTSYLFPPYNLGGAGNLLQQAGGYGHLLKVRPLCRPLSSGSQDWKLGLSGLTLKKMTGATSEVHSEKSLALSTFHI